MRWVVLSWTISGCGPAAGTPEGPEPPSSEPESGGQTGQSGTGCDPPSGETWAFDAPTRLGFSAAEAFVGVSVFTAAVNWSDGAGTVLSGVLTPDGSEVAQGSVGLPGRGCIEVLTATTTIDLRTDDGRLALGLDEGTVALPEPGLAVVETDVPPQDVVLDPALGTVEDEVEIRLVIVGGIAEGTIRVDEVLVATLGGGS